MNKPAGSKLFKFKDWVTLPDAAKHLSGVCDEEVTEADTLQFALEGHLKLSVNFVNNVIVARKILFPICSGTDLVRNRDERLISFGGEVKTISGVWDLPMDGGERLDVEHEYQRLTGGPAVTRKQSMAFVKGTSGEIWQLQERFGYAEHDADLKAHRDELKQLVTRKSIDLEKGKELMMRYYKQMEPFRVRVALLPESEYCYYYPAKNLPQDSILVVRTEALREFEQLIANNSVTQTNSNKSDLSETERNNIVDIYAQRKDSFDSWHKKSGANIKALTVKGIFNQVKQADTSLWNIGLSTFQRDFWQRFRVENNLVKRPGRRSGK